MDYSLQIQKILLKRNEVNLPDDKIAFIKQAINLADAHNDKIWGFDLRIELIDEEANTSRCIESFPAFAWMLDVYDQEPELYSTEALLSRYRLLIRDAYRNVNIEKQQIDNMLGDFQLRLIKGGYSLRTYYTLRADFDYYINDADGVLEKLRLRDDQPVNHDLDYWLDELNDDIELALMYGDFDKALHLTKQFTLNELDYFHYPLAIYSSFVQYLTRKQDLRRAHEFFLMAEECLHLIQNDSSPVSSVGKLIRFLTVYDANKAWQYFERYIDWTVNADDFTTYLFSANILLLLKNTPGEVKLVVNPVHKWYQPDGVYKVADLFDYYYSVAITFAEKFDKRNASSNFTKRIYKEIGMNGNAFTRLWNKLTKLFS